jgi:hypothetical protein
MNPARRSFCEVPLGVSWHAAVQFGESTGGPAGEAGVQDDAAEGKDWTVSADSTIARAHQHAAGARHAPAVDLPTGGRIE